MNAILRHSYLDKIEHHLGKDTIIILTGQRRIGKSYILRLFRNKVSKEAGANVIFIDKEKHEFDDIKTYRDLNAYIDERRNKAMKNYILVDEIQDIVEFEKSVRSYYEEPDVEIVVTGSNSKMLSRDLSTLIGGRYKEIYIQALSYEEFMLFHQLSDSDDTLAKYIQFGGLPGLVKMGLDKDQETINIINEMMPDVPLCVDVNQGWTSKEHALEMCHWLKDRNCIFVEQPFDKEMIDETAWLRERSPLPIIADEAFQRLPDILRFQGVYDGINIKLMKSTGLYEAHKMVTLAKSLGMKVMIGCMTETSCAVTAAANLSPVVDFADLDGNLLIANDRFDGMTVENGKITLHDIPGLGITPIPGK